MARARLTPAHTCIHTLMYVHCFRADFHLKQWEIYSKFKAARTKHIFFPWETTDLMPFQTLEYIWSAVESSLCSETGVVATISRYLLQAKKNNPADLGISSKQFLHRTQKICSAVYQILQAAQEQIRLLLCFLTMKCRLLIPSTAESRCSNITVCLS